MATTNGSTSNYNKLAQGLATLEADVANQNRVLERLESAIDALSNKVNRGSNWGVLGTWSAVMISIVSGLGYLALIPIQDDLAENRDSILAQTDAFVAHIQDGHPKMVLDKMQGLKEEVEENEKEALREMQKVTAQMAQLRAAKDSEIKTMIAYEAEITDSKLLGQRELIQAKLDHMSDLVAKNTLGVTELDDMLQREMRLLDEILQREMGLNVGRLQEQANNNELRSKERHEMQQELLRQIQESK